VVRLIVWQVLDRGCETVWQRGFALLLASAIGVGFAHYGYRVLGHGFLDKYPPVWTIYETIKAAGLMLASWLVFAALRPVDEQLRDAGWRDLPAGWLPVSVFVLVASALAVIFWPDFLTEHMEEKHVLGVLSELSLLVALMVLARSAWCARGSNHRLMFGLRPAWPIGAMMLVVFLILMEEMSWGQHWLGLTTPALFEGNRQNEINFHNFYTNAFESAYYSTAVLLLVVLPFAWPHRVPKIAASLSIFIPPPSFAILALPLCGFFFETWNFVTNQILFYLGFFIAAHLFRRANNRSEKRATFIIAALLLASQIIFLDHGHTLPHGWALTEVREIAIPLAIVAYGVWLFSRLRSGSVGELENAPAQ